MQRPVGSVSGTGQKQPSVAGRRSRVGRNKVHQKELSFLLGHLSVLRYLII